MEQLLNDLEDFKQEMEDAFETVGADSTNINIQTLQTDVHTFPLRIVERIL